MTRNLHVCYAYALTGTLLLCLWSEARATEYMVPNIADINTAIGLCSSGDTITVATSSPQRDVNVDIPNLLVRAGNGYSPVIEHDSLVYGSIYVQADGLTLRGFTIIADDAGVAMTRESQTETTVEDCVFTSSGTAYWHINGNKDLTIRRCTFENAGGAIIYDDSPGPPGCQAGGTLTIEDCLFNQTAVVCDCLYEVDISGSTFDGMSSYALLDLPSNSTIERCIFTDCSTVFSGGSCPTITKSLFYGNTSIGNSCSISGNLTSDPLFCDEHESPVQKFTLRMDSEAAPGNNTWGVLIGARKVECAWGDLARSTTVASGTRVLALEDVRIPHNRALTLDSGVTILFDDDDAATGSGEDTDRNELIVDGTLTISGSSSDRDSLKSSTGVAGDWRGITFENQGVATIDYAAISDADIGIESLYNQGLTVTNSTFEADTTADMVVERSNGQGTVDIEDNEFDVGKGIGVKFTAATGEHRIQDNTFTLDSNSIIGLYCSGRGPSSYPISGNTISGGSSAHGIEFEDAEDYWTLENNSISGCQYGLYSYQTSSSQDFTPTIGGNTSGKGNSISGCMVGVWTSGSHILGDYEYNTISSNGTGVRVQSGADPNFGNTTSGLGGYNRFLSNTNYCLRNVNTSGTVMAQANYFGEVSCEDPPFPTCTDGSFNLSGVLCTDPSSMEMKKVPVEGRILALRAMPNPMTAGTDLQFVLGADGKARIAIFDLAGRLVRDFGEVGQGIGDHSVRWDGTDGTGRPVMTGLYFVKLTIEPGATETIKVLVER